MKRNDKILMWMGIVALTLFMMLGWYDFTHAHGVHLSDVQNDFCPMVAGPNWHQGIGAVLATQCEGQPMTWWLMSKKGDFTHVGVHVEQLTLQQMEGILGYEYH